MNFILKLILNGVAVMAVAEILPGVSVEGLWSAIIVSLLLSFLNVFLKPLLIILTIPFTILTLGLFLLVINALIISIADTLINGFSVDGFWWAILFSLLLSLLNSFLERLSK